MKLAINLVLALVAIAAGVFSYQNFSDAKQLNIDIEGLVKQNKNLETSIKDSTTAKTDATKALEVANGRVNAADGAIATLQQNINDGGGVLAGLKAQYKEKNDEYQKVLTGLEEIRKLFPGLNLDEVPGKIQELEQELIDLKKSVKNNKLATNGVIDRITSAKASIARSEQALADRETRIKSNSIETTVTAVSEDWNFVLLSAGGLYKVQDRLIVKRGSDYIGKVLIEKIESGQVVAAVVDGSVASGLSIRPGDQIIREAAYSN